MDYLQIAVCIVIGIIILSLGWDFTVYIRGVSDATVCQATRVLNAKSDGLLGLCGLALWIHIFCVQWFPSAWTHSQSSQRSNSNGIQTRAQGPNSEAPR